MNLRTPLYQEHISQGARMVSFAGWEMPIHCGSQLEEHHAVRRDVGLFDVSHMTILDLDGTESSVFLRWLLANDIARLKTTGKALYSCMLQEQGRILDDLIVYRMSDDWYRIVVNAATADGDIAWIQTQADKFAVNIRHRIDLAMIAIQGPKAHGVILQKLPGELRDSVAMLKPFNAVTQDDWFLARTGYTGEDGFELMLPGGMASALWRTLVATGVRPCGLGARDTLRLEAGMNLYGTDMDTTNTPLECGLAWTVAWEPIERNFIGRAALEAQRTKGGLPRFVGLLLEGKGVLRNHQPVFSGDTQVGIITSGSFSPTLKRAIALARLPVESDTVYEVEMLGRRVPVRVVKPIFVRNGRSVISPW